MIEFIFYKNINFQIEERMKEMFGFLDINKKIIEEDNGETKTEVYDQ